MTARREEGHLVLVVGPFPPPVHGMAVVTAQFLGRLGSLAERADLSPGFFRRGARYHLAKGVRVFRAIVRIAAPRAPRILYLAADAHWGLLYSAVLALVARVRRRDVVIHHHSFAYVAERYRRMALLVRAAGPRALHVLLCAEMERGFRRRYASVERTAVVHNAVFLDPATPRPHATPGPRLGHLSNLSVDKGLDLVIEAFREIKGQIEGATLVIAGPPADAAATAMIEAARQEFGHRIRVRGPVGPEEKARFFDEIDVFLFPSRYVNEAQPLVLLEAMRHGVPSVSVRRGCIADLLSDGGGRCADSIEGFVGEAVAAARSWRDPPMLAEARRRARSRFEAVRAQGESGLQDLLRMMGLSSGS